ncbi:hypothetical protein TWF694_006287 [Orbilia ellipsospora]|uniref:CFEM domain-containing protein n=1 Tax=Orbilia ellipsospora TaxID=2528407 RepID=A0AAV9XRD2_9PEZI
MALSQNLLFLSCLGAISTAIPTTPLLKARQFGSVSNPNDTVDVSGVPECAVANCVTSGEWIPARLGCHTGNLTRECFCQTAVAPLTCSPKAPSSEDNCFYELQTWFSGICGQNAVRIADLSAIPDCGRDCTAAMITEEDCADDSLNCICQKPEIYNKTATCLSQACSNTKVFKYLDDTPDHFAYSWYTILCQTGVQEPFNEAGYQSWINNGKWSHSLKVGLGVGLGIGSPVLICLWIIVNFTS